MLARLPLEGFYLYLVRNGFPLSVRDYQDAVAALQAGYGLLRRDELLWLCAALWARSEEQELRLRRLFDEFPWPTPEVLAELTHSPRPVPSPPADRPGQDPEASIPTPSPPAPAVEFGAPDQRGLGLPRAQISPAELQTFMLTPRPPLSLRALTVIWRRFRLARRDGPKVEIDIPATIAAQCRQGYLLEPVAIPARRNQARLVVLLDASPSMVAWGYLGRWLAESLARSQLGHWALYFFRNDPGGKLFASDRLLRPSRLETVAKQHPDCAVLVVSDAGAARGYDDAQRVAGAQAFIRAAAQVSWQPVAWANPMPRRRWAATTAQQIAALPGLAMSEFSEDGLVQAVDYLRGKQHGQP